MAKRLVYSLVFLVVAIVLWQAPNISDRLKENKGPDRWLNLEPQEILIDKTKLYRLEDEWWVLAAGTSQPADEEKIGQLVDDLKAIELDVPVSENENNFELMGIKEAATIKAGGKELKVGSIGNQGETTYVLTAGAVYEVSAVINKNLWTEDYWRREWVTNLPRYQIKKITVENKGEVTEWESKEGSFENEKLADSASNLKIDSYAGRDLDWDKKAERMATVTIETEGESQEIVVGQTTANRKAVYWAREKAGKDYFVISQQDALILTAN